jgi:hypothetical protein
MNAQIEEVVEKIIQYNDKWRYTLNRTPQRYHIGCATVTHDDVYSMYIDVPDNEWLDWLRGAALYWHWQHDVGVSRYDGRAVLRLYVSSPQGIATMIRLAVCSCGSCEHIRRSNAPLPSLSPSPTSCYDEPELYGRGWQIVWCGGRYVLRLSTDAIRTALAEALIAASEYSLTPLTYYGRNYSIDLYRGELTIRIATPVSPRAAGYLYAAAADVTWNWRYTPNIVLYDNGLEVVTRITTYILGVPNIRGIATLLYAVEMATKSA